MQSTVERIRSMALVHEALYGSEVKTEVDVRSFVDRIVHELRTAYAGEDGVQIQFEIGGASLGVDAAVPISLMINELVTNALKYAFPDGRQGIIYVGLHSQDDRTTELVVRDNGIGLPEDFNLSGLVSLGVQLVQGPTEQLSGTLAVDGRDGTTFSIRFPSAR